MRSRLAIMAVLVTGILMSGASAGLAVSGLSGSGSAGVAQYGPSVLPKTDSNTPNNDVLGETNGASPQAAQETRQLATDNSNQIPFTGYAAIPVLLIGIALLSLGVVMRRRAGSDRS
jgi:hypothetical protein